MSKPVQLASLLWIWGCGGTEPSGAAETDVQDPVGSSGSVGATDAGPDGAGSSGLMGGSGGSGPVSSSEESGLSSESGAPEPADSRCEIDGATLTCAYQTTTVLTGASGLVPREVHWQVPLGAPPEDGWPTAIVFQGSLFTAELFWTAAETDALGFWNQGLLTKRLLDRGFAVITPEALLQGSTAWQTNIPPASLAWELSADHQFMLDLFAELERDTFGPLDEARLYAAGISSGGYMTSRMDEAYRDRFVALAIQSASWATCGGPACVVPDDLDAGHLPTLFLHGSADTIVPLWTMELYADALNGLGVETESIVAPGVGHAWIDESPVAVVEWFESH